jgi:beta-glucosidase/6-phospho-beta-glucosidase/beta-galactosidase
VGWSFDPRALRIALRECYERFHLPLMVCENGWSQREELGADGTVHDAKRIDYIREHVASMSQAIDEGVDLIGCTYWSFVDILSSSDGMGKRYGLVYVDREDFDEKECARHPKDSFWYYQKVTAPVPVAPLKDGPKSYRLMVACGNQSGAIPFDRPTQAGQPAKSSVRFFAGHSQKTGP